MNTQRYELNRYGVSRFEIVDTKARPIARQIRVLDAMPLTDAEAIVRNLNSKVPCPVCEDMACETKSVECGR